MGDGQENGTLYTPLYLRLNDDGGTITTRELLKYSSAAPAYTSNETRFLMR